MTPILRHGRHGDRGEFTRMRRALWSDSTADEAEEVLGRAPTRYLVVVAEEPGGGLCGFAEAGLRDYAEGCLSSPVAYLEGIWVDPEHRRSRVGAALVKWVESWAGTLGLSGWHRTVSWRTPRAWASTFPRDSRRWSG